MSTLTRDALAVTKTNHPSKRDATATPGKTAITIILFGTIFLGIGVTTWSMLRAEFQKTFHEFSACPIIAMDHASLHGRDANRVAA